uniref:NADH dehydrogenase [ubiquinone] 1 beta subcomplex subunit 11, mitochondrial n=1 Tax=Aplanochytrium stocchinoi TaxID=215587 RepID=A0A7S3UYB4_9STRA|mmetsp:Transcript_17720/g.21836  ORF Transcript_17720/g.21836 Transcript_17720/m.21836 type:complete len:138 (-) Transcript_17720:328-741(-)|eukprot:CAMPEP_0204826316 /NCGR_PEP_ID=MMETSP1346-20131115/4035_1 /ASSEMBLY_ACC=CAM_ASM_000771 /TAXON_ID=215587 /ORGANISM="Aplanochytrium stocchinoi, Strain GSBS06" /LENGTH=137 /DNA_ID=CAMNT_0051954293 /DNA_START=156 /DNA_END=569 /DNA_ORIENTATION=+
MLQRLLRPSSAVGCAIRSGSASTFRRFGTDASKPKREVYMFGEKPGPRKWESWEAQYYFFMGASALVTIVGLTYKPETSIKAWARDEAEVRNQMIEEGKEVEMGVNYSQRKFGNVWAAKTVGERPVRAADADEEDDE